ncbi:MAG: signal peptidase I [Myxococcota bacterium]
MNRRRAIFGIIVCTGIVLVSLGLGPPVARSTLRSPSLAGALPERGAYWVVRWPMALCGPHPGQIVLFHAPESTGDLAGAPFVKRVAAVAGDRVAVREGVLVRNGEPVDEPWRDLADGPGPDLSETVVPPDHLLVLGDRRGKTYDGRTWGMLARDRLVGIKLPCHAAP